MMLKLALRYGLEFGRLYVILLGIIPTILMSSLIWMFDGDNTLPLYEELADLWSGWPYYFVVAIGIELIMGIAIGVAVLLLSTQNSTKLQVVGGTLCGTILGSALWTALIFIPIQNDRASVFTMSTFILIMFLGGMSGSGNMLLIVGGPTFLFYAVSSMLISRKLAQAQKTPT